MKQLSVTALAAALLMPCAVMGQQTKRLTAEKHNEYGIVYTLPVTALSVTVKARKTVTVPGPFHQYAKQCLGTSEVATTESTVWDVTDVNVEPFGIADRNEEYLMQLKPGALTYVTVGTDGMLLAINADEQPDGHPAAEAVLLSTDGEADYNPNAYLQYASEDFLASQSSLKQAQMLAESIMEVRDAKISLTRGTADNMPTDGRQLELMLQSLSHQEEVMTKAFTGNTYSQLMEATYTFIPDREGRFVVLRINDFEGFTDADDLSGEPMYITIDNIETATLPKDEKGEDKKLPKDAVIYTIPGSARVSLTWRGRQVVSRQFEMAQYGVQFGLNPLLFTDKKAPSYLIIDPATGGIRSIGAVSELDQ